MSKMYIEIININIIKIHYKRQNKLNIFSEWGGRLKHITITMFLSRTGLDFIQRTK